MGNNRVERNSKFELLRILCMFLIVASHLGAHGGYNFSAGMSATNKAIVKYLAINGRLGVNVLVLISGYFMINSKFRLKKALKLLFDVVFYSVVIFLILSLFGVVRFSVKDLIYSFLPSGSYWFIWVYLKLYLLSPMINWGINNITRSQHKLIIVLLILIQSILPQFFEITICGNLGWFIMLYLIGAYLRKYNIEYISLGFSLVCFLFWYCYIAFAYVRFNIYLSNLTNIELLICSVFLFMLFKNIKFEKSVKLINIIASATFGIYLIHENDYLRPLIWRTLLKCPEYALTNDFWWISILFIVCVYIGCTIIEFVRIYCINKPTINIWNSCRKHIKRQR